MTESETIKKAIRYFECMKNDAVVVLDSGFGTHPGESDLVYRNRKMYAKLAINALEKQIPKKPIIKHINTSEEATEIEYTCSVCGTNFVELTPCMEWCPYCGNKIYWSDEE